MYFFGIKEVIDMQDEIVDENMNVSLKTEVLYAYSLFLRYNGTFENMVIWSSKYNKLNVKIANGWNSYFLLERQNGH